MTGRGGTHHKTAHRFVDPDHWHASVQALCDQGFHLRSVHAAGADRGAAPAASAVVLRAALQLGHRWEVLETQPGSRPIPTLTDIAPISWDEREAHDRHGIEFAGHAVEPLLDHGRPLVVPDLGPDVHEVPVGPIHAGIIESGHFRFGMLGDRIHHVGIRLFHKHRGIERAAIGRDPVAACSVVARACGACHVTNTVAFQLAVEQIAGSPQAVEVQACRAALLELERCWSHVNDLGAVCAGIGFAPGAQLFAAYKERVHRVLDSLAGHRLLFGATLAPPAAAAGASEHWRVAVDELARIGADVARTWTRVLFTPSVEERLRGVGIVDADDARRLGSSGPAARAAGIVDDERAVTWEALLPGLVPVHAPEAVGDVLARVEQRVVELAQSIEILVRLVGVVEHRRAPWHVPDALPDGIGAAAIEGPRGRTTCVVEVAGGVVVDVRLRTGSYANWPAVPVAATGELLPEFPLVNKSFELCYACVDR